MLAYRTASTPTLSRRAQRRTGMHTSRVCRPARGALCGPHGDAGRGGHQQRPPQYRRTTGMATHTHVKQITPRPSHAAAITLLLLLLLPLLLLSCHGQ